MSQEKIIVFPEIGQVRLVKNSRFRRLSIRMAPAKGIWVNIPPGFTFADGETLLDEHRDWILKNRSKIQQKEAQRTIFSPENEFRTKYHSLQICAHKKQALQASLKDGILRINYPDSLSVEAERVQDFIRKSLVETLRREAQYYLPHRVQELAKEFGFQHGKVSVRNAKTRWGSCSHDNRISLNIHLIRMPSHLIDYVILHELCHTIEKNHSSNFWDLMKKVCPQVQAFRKEMKRYSPTIF
ncbi:MAG: M48 family metallopeptidase [Marinifilaceae bacterium]